MSNRPTLSDIADKSSGDLVSMSALELGMLLEECDAQRKSTEALKKKLKSAVEQKYAVQLSDHTTGTDKFEDGEAVVKISTTKKVTWDQGILNEAWATLENEWQEDPSEYIDMKASVSERKYGAWPTPIKKLFDPARTVAPGTTSITIEQKEAE